jgi:2-isopropylmalate synthase
MSIKTRQDVFKADTNIKTTEIYRTSRMVARLMGIEVQPNKAIVGANAFAHESGIHQDGWLKNRSTYEIMTPESVGVQGSKMVLGRHSGRHGFKARCQELGIEVDEQQLNTLYENFLQLADKKKEIFDEDIIALLDDKSTTTQETYHLEYLHCIAGTGTIPSATVRINKQGEILQAAAWGDGPVDATYNAIQRATGLEPKMENYTIRAVTESSEALGEATLRIRHEGKAYIGRGVSTDIIEASAKAFINALNHAVARENKK